ncbi:MAG TPA: amino acid permease [Micromonosporaceae bacterium]
MATLRRAITLPQATALYAGSVIGAGVLVLPGVAARLAGPASLLAWLAVALLGVPIALTFAALAARFPAAGGVAAFTRRAFGPAAATVVGWFYFFAASVAQAAVAMTGGHYVAAAFGVDPYLVAAAVLVGAVLANLRGIRVSAGVQLGLSASVVAVLVVAAALALPRVSTQAFTPFAPHGWDAVGAAAVMVFFSCFGWEAITHLSAEFRDPARDAIRATLLAVAAVTTVYLGIAVAVVGTRTYGAPDRDRVAVVALLGGADARAIGAAAALLITAGTVNVFVAATSRLGYALFPALGRVSSRGVPAAAVAAVGGIAGAALALAVWRGWGAEAYVVLPSSMGLTVYVVGCLAGVRLLRGWSRAAAAVSALACAAIVPFAGVALWAQVTIAAAALTWYVLRGRREREPASDQAVVHIGAMR